ncbi:uncharacterized protein C5L36_0C02240 [Pichia kudriavzevii]|uniref:ATP-dependent RNA helicase n=1 Tax=Pichia kudriavzevii TaxID=4909 RepID=A0A2U9R4J7_PICKU|nr:uncharacterized protein C5L36_0C02240 [Pichia kudriavzevii]AWU76280.1 hypothetical protein C5L36_0C02240 [Pichia kudriavzevii]
MFSKRYDPNTKPGTSGELSGRRSELLKKIKARKLQGSAIAEIQPDVEMRDSVAHVEDSMDVSEDEKVLKRKRESMGSEFEEESESEDESEPELNAEISQDETVDKVAEGDVMERDDIQIDTPHASIISRFQQVMNKQPSLAVEEEVDEKDEPIEYKDVAPLPQPKLPRDKQLYSQLHKNKSLDWLTKPAFYDSSLSKPFKDFDPALMDIILRNLYNEFKIENAFSVQVTLIEELLKDIKRGRLDPTPRGDYLINAATGSGKTLSYLIPIVQYIMGYTQKLRIKDSGIQAIIIVPTKPLVQQVYSDALKLTKGTDINVMALKSGGDLSIQGEKLRIESNLTDILITTPGRLVEHLEVISMKSLRFLVVDEADRLLNQNFQDWCDLVMNKIERISNVENEGLDVTFKLRCIKIVLSATLTTNSEKLTHLRLFKPRLVIVNSTNNNELYQLPRTLNEKLLNVSEKLSYFKPLILLRLFEWIDKEKFRYDNFGLIFTKSNESTIRLSKLLNLLVMKLRLKLRIGNINSMMDNLERMKILKNFDENGGILICTDLLSRGINLTSIKFVINYDLPGSTKEYIHRIGRTARAGNLGNAITMCFGEGEFKWFKRIVYSGQQINRNGKPITDIKFNKEHDEELWGKDEVDEFVLTIGEMDKQIYQECLRDL